MQVESPRDQRFKSPLTINRSSTNPTQFAQSPLLYKYSLERRQHIQKEAVIGLLSYGQKHGCQTEANQFAKLLDRVIAQKKDKAIGDIAIHLYTKQSFLYKHINKYLQDSEFQSEGQNNGSSQSYVHSYDLLPYSFLLNDYVKERTRQGQFKGTVYRSCILSQQQIEEYVANVGQYRQWYGFTSATKNRKKAEQFGNVLFLIKLGQSQQTWGFHYGLQADKYSEFPQQEQVLLYAGMRIMTQKVVKCANRYLITIICIDMGIQ